MDRLLDAWTAVQTYLLTHSEDGSRALLHLFDRNLSRRSGFEEEVFALSKVNERVSHPVLARVIKQGKRKDRLFLLCERAGAETLADRIAGNRISIEDVINVSRSVGGAVFACHRARYVHGDVRADTILMGEDGSLQIRCPGILPLVWSSVGKHDLDGRDEFAPELSHGRQPSPRSDAYSFAMALRSALRVATPRPPDHLDMDLSEIIDAALAPDAAARTDDVRSLALEVANLLGGTIGEVETREEEIAPKKTAVAPKTLAIGGVAAGLAVLVAVAVLLPRGNGDTPVATDEHSVPAAAPVPAEMPEPEPTPLPTPSPTPAATPSPTPTPTPTPVPTPSPTPPPSISWEDAANHTASGLREAESVVMILLACESDACRNFEEDVLSDPALVAATESGVLLVREAKGTDGDLAKAWSSIASPEVILLKSDGTVAARYTAGNTASQIAYTIRLLK